MQANDLAQSASGYKEPKKDQVKREKAITIGSYTRIDDDCSHQNLGRLEKASD